MSIKHILKDGTVEWRHDGRLHREDGPAVIYPSGGWAWLNHGLRHRLGGPAVYSPNYSQEWYYYGSHHREDGPAIELNTGSKLWFINGKELSQLEHFYKSPYWETLSDEERMHYRLTIA